LAIFYFFTIVVARSFDKNKRKKYFKSTFDTKPNK
jgi:hypothetical protein